MNKKIIFSLALLSAFSYLNAAYIDDSAICQNNTKPNQCAKERWQLEFGNPNSANHTSNFDSCLKAYDPNSGDTKGEKSFNKCTILGKAHDNFYVQCINKRNVELARDARDFHMINLLSDRFKAKYDALRVCGIEHYDSRRYDICKYFEQGHTNLCTKKKDGKNFIELYKDLVENTLNKVSDEYCKNILSTELDDIKKYKNNIKQPITKYTEYYVYGLPETIDILKSPKHNFTVEPKYNVRTKKKVIQEYYKEFYTNTTGRIQVKSDAGGTYNRTLIYLLDQFHPGWQVENFAKYIVGNRSATNWSQGLGYLNWGSANEKIGDEIVNKVVDTEYNKIIHIDGNSFNGAQGAGNVYGHFLEYTTNIGEDLKNKIYEYLFLKNSRVTPITSDYFPDFEKNKERGGNLGGPSKCYNYDLQKFKSEYSRTFHFDYKNQSDFYFNDGAQNSQPKIFDFSIHKTYGNLKGVFEEGKTTNFSINIRPSFDNSDPFTYNQPDNKFDEYKNSAYSSIKLNFYPDAKKIRVVKADGGYNATIELLDINNNPLNRDGLPDKLHISKYKVKGSEDSIYADGILLKHIEKGTYKIDCDNYVSKKACAALKDNIKDKDAAFIIQEIKETIEDDNKSYARPVFQTDGYNIIKGEETEISKEEPLSEDSFLPYKAWITSGKEVVKDLSNLKTAKNNGEPKYQILTRTADDMLYFALENTKNYQNIWVEIVETDGKKYAKLSKVINIANGSTPPSLDVKYKDGTSKKLYKLEKDLLFELKQHEVGRHDLTLKIYTIDTNTVKLIHRDNNKIPLEDIKGASVKEEMSINQHFSVRHKGLIYETNKKDQLANKTEDFDFKVNSCKVGNDSFKCENKDTVAKDNKLTYAGLYIQDEKTPGKDAYLYLDDGVGLLNNDNAKNPKTTVDLESGKAIIKTSLPLVSKAEIRLFETYLTNNDANNEQCKPFDETIMDLKALNEINAGTGQIYCQTPMCKNTSGTIKCDGKGFEYEFKSEKISLNLKNEEEPIKELKGLVPYAGKEGSKSGETISIDDIKALKISLNIQDKDSYYINFAKDENKDYGLVSLDLSFTQNTKPIKQDDKKEEFKYYTNIIGGSDIVVLSSVNKESDCGYTETITGENVNVGKCINIKNDSAFKMLDELKKANESTKLSDLLNDSRFKASDNYGGLTLEVAYPKVDANGNFKTQSPFKVTLQNGYVSNEVSNTNDKYELNKASKSHLFTKTGLYFKDVSNNDGRLFYDKKDLKNPVNNGIKFINENNKIEDLKDCGSEPCYSGKIENLISDKTKLKWDYQDSTLTGAGYNLTYEPNINNKAEYIKDTIRYSADKWDYLGSEKNSFTLEYKRN